MVNKLYVLDDYPCTLSIHCRDKRKEAHQAVQLGVLQKGIWADRSKVREIATTCTGAM